MLLDSEILCLHVLFLLLLLFNLFVFYWRVLRHNKELASFNVQITREREKNLLSYL